MPLIELHCSSFKPLGVHSSGEGGVVMYLKPTILSSSDLFLLSSPPLSLSFHFTWRLLYVRSKIREREKGRDCVRVRETDRERGGCCLPPYPQPPRPLSHTAFVCSSAFLCFSVACLAMLLTVCVWASTIHSTPNHTTPGSIAIQTRDTHMKDPAFYSSGFYRTRRAGIN